MLSAFSVSLYTFPTETPLPYRPYLNPVPAKPARSSFDQLSFTVSDAVRSEKSSFMSVVSSSDRYSVTSRLPYTVTETSSILM